MMLGGVVKLRSFAVTCGSAANHMADNPPAAEQPLLPEPAGLHPRKDTVPRIAAFFVCPAEILSIPFDTDTVIGNPESGYDNRLPQRR
jgi:hypothetical protein